MSLRAFCARAGVPLHGLYYWRNKLKLSDNAQLGGFTEIRPAVAPVLPALPRPEGVIEVRLANGRTVRVSGGHVDAKVLQTVIEMADAGSAC